MSFPITRALEMRALRSLRIDKRRLGYSSVWGGARSPRVRGVYPPADHFSVFVLRYNFASEL